MGSSDNGPILAQFADQAPAVHQSLPGPAALRPIIPRPAPEPLSQLLSPICAALALVSSLGAIVYSIYSPLALIPAGLAIVLGACGVYSRLRAAALLGILLASMAIGICMFQIAAEYYQVRKGVSPFAPNAPVESGGRL